jgi:hypothetical protein
MKGRSDPGLRAASGGARYLRQRPQGACGGRLKVFEQGIARCLSGASQGACGGHLKVLERGMKNFFNLFDFFDFAVKTYGVNAPLRNAQGIGGV